MTKRLLTLAAALVLAGCSLDKQSIPSPSGPSELGLSLALSASPDVLNQDGISQSRLDIVARDASGNAVSGLSLRIDPYVGTTISNAGTWSARSVATGSDGRASAVYQAPPPGTFAKETILTVAVTPSNSLSRTITIRLVPYSGS